jgi:hypothetical protein
MAGRPNPPLVKGAMYLITLEYPPFVKGDKGGFVPRMSGVQELGIDFLQGGSNLKEATLLRVILVLRGSYGKLWKRNTPLLFEVQWISHPLLLIDILRGELSLCHLEMYHSKIRYQ